MPIESNEPPDPSFVTMTSADDIVHSLLNGSKDKVGKNKNRKPHRGIKVSTHGSDGACSVLRRLCSAKVTRKARGRADESLVIIEVDGIASAETGNVCDREIAGSGTGFEHNNMEDVVSISAGQTSSHDGIDKDGSGFVFGKNVNSAGFLKKPLGPVFNVQFINVVKSNPFGRFAKKLKKGSKAIALKTEFTPNYVIKKDNGKRRIEFSAKEIRGANLVLCNCMGTLWVCVYNFPMELCNDNWIGKIMSGMGKPLLMDNMTKERCLKKSGKLNFTRDLVEVLTDDDLPSLLEISYPPNGNWQAKVGVLDVKYQWKPPICTHCKTFGHSTLSCKVRPRTEEEIAAKNLRDALKIGKYVVHDSGKKNVDDEGKNNIGNNAPVQEVKKKSLVEKPMLASTYNKDFGPKVLVRGSGSAVAGMSSLSEDVPVNSFQVLDDEVMKDQEECVFETMEEDIIMNFYNKCHKYGLDPSYEDDDVATEDGDMAKEMRAEDVDLDAYNSDIGTKVKKRNLVNICSTILGPWQWVSNNASCSNGTRIIVGWDTNSIGVMVISQSTQLMNLFVESIDGHHRFYCSFFYAYVRASGRKPLWRELIFHSLVVKDEPWVLMGDINVILDPLERSVGSSYFTASMEEFRDCLGEIGVEDLWSCSAFMEKFVNSNAQFLPFVASDHTFAVVEIPVMSRAKPRPFKFANFLADKEEFLPIIKNVWDSHIPRHVMFTVVSKLKLLKKPLRKLKVTQGDLAKKVAESRHESERVQTMKVDDSHNSVLRNKEIECLKMYKDAMRDEESMLKQRAKVTWLSEGDANTKFFHKTVKGNSNRNRIENIEDMEGFMFSSQYVRDQFVKHFHSVLSEARRVVPISDLGSLFNKRLSPEVVKFLVRPVSREKIKSVIFAMNDDKAPGPDGFSFEFLRHLGLLLVMKCVLLLVFLGMLVDESQNAFIPLRQISDNILLTQELIRIVGRQKWRSRLTFIRQLSVHSVMIIRDALKEFSDVSGLVPNLDKSSVFFGNVPGLVKASILRVMPFSVGFLPVRYLGLPLLSSRLFKHHCSGLIDNVKKRLMNYKNKALSDSIFILPKAVNAEIKQLMHGFLWSHGDLRMGNAKVKWKDVCLLKNQGGLDSLWVKWANAYRLIDRSSNVRNFWDVPILNDICWGWRELLQCRDVLRENFVCRIGVGSQTFVWYDNWLSLVWRGKFPFLFQLPPPLLFKDRKDIVLWRLIRFLRTYQRSNDGKVGNFSVSDVWTDFLSLILRFSRQVMEAVELWNIGVEDSNGGNNFSFFLGFVIWIVAAVVHRRVCMEGKEILSDVAGRGSFKGGSSNESYPHMATRVVSNSNFELRTMDLGNTFDPNSTHLIHGSIVQTHSIDDVAKAAPKGTESIASDNINVAKIFGVSLKTLKDFDNITRAIKLGKHEAVFSRMTEERCNKVMEAIFNYWKLIEERANAMDQPKGSDPIVQYADINTKLTSYAGAAGATVKVQPKVSNFRPLTTELVFNGVNISIPHKVIEKGRSSFAWCLLKVNSEADLVDYVTIGIPSLTRMIASKKPSVLSMNEGRLDVMYTNNGFQMVGKKRRRKAPTSAPKKVATNMGNAFSSSSLLKNNATSSNQENITSTNSYSVLNVEDEEEGEYVENVSDETANLFPNDGNPPFDKMTSADDIVHSSLNGYKDKVGKNKNRKPYRGIKVSTTGLAGAGFVLRHLRSAKVTRKARGRADESPDDNRGRKRATNSHWNDEISEVLSGLRTGSEHTNMEDVVSIGAGQTSSQDGIASDKGGSGFVFGKNVNSVSQVMFSTIVDMFDEKLKQRSDEMALKMEFTPNFVIKQDHGKRRIEFYGEEITKGGGEACSMQLHGYFVGTSMDYRVVRGNLMRMWRIFDIEDITKTNSGVFYFKFKSEDGMKKVLESAPWMIMSGVGKPLLMDNITKERCLKKLGKLDFARVLVEVSTDDDFHVRWKFIILLLVTGWLKLRTEEEIAAKNLRDALKIGKPVFWVKGYPGLSRYKAISKIIANRIKGFLSMLVNENQNAFIPSRQISDNVLLTQELIRNYHRNWGPSKVAFKIDIHKAHGYFNGMRGLRQGDPLSLYLFTLVMEVFSLMVKRKIEDDEGFKYHWRCENLKITHLGFADDLMLFSRADVHSVNILSLALKDFSGVPGLVPNFDKSSVFFGNIPGHVKYSILHLMPFAVGVLPVRYLGLPLISTRLFKHHCSGLIDNVKKRLMNWRNKALSFAAIIAKIDQLMCGFLWSHGELKRGHAKVRWKDVWCLKNQGGLGGLDDMGEMVIGFSVIIKCKFGWDSQRGVMSDVVCVLMIPWSYEDIWKLWISWIAYLWADPNMQPIDTLDMVGS
uniref:RNA-directed DNA polymerase, eukaryota, reverse transcriptase zinc-binding domain protein n=1 Tax=Tanacetum cinerariifolium TaxID=118510 RepID=A0A6L2NMR0_TANCI|nr:hypothetical protein [Tanacetum cinerariifolium]